MPPVERIYVMKIPTTNSPIREFFISGVRLGPAEAEAEARATQQTST